MWTLAGQYSGAGLGYKNVIFYSYAELARHIYAGLNRENHLCP